MGLRMGHRVESLLTFDLTDLAEKADVARRFRARLSFAQVGLGVALVVVGAYFYVTPPPQSIPRFSVGPLLFVLIGAILTGVASWVRSSLGPSPRRLEVSQEELVFSSIPHRLPLRIDWKQPALKLEIYDLRQTKVAGQATRRRGYDFLIQAAGGPETAVPLSAYETIVRIAEGHGLRITRRDVPSGAGGPMVVTTIRSSS